MTHESLELKLDTALLWFFSHTSAWCEVYRMSGYQKNQRIDTLTVHTYKQRLLPF